MPLPGKNVGSEGPKQDPGRVCGDENSQRSDWKDAVGRLALRPLTPFCWMEWPLCTVEVRKINTAFAAGVLDGAKALPSRWTCKSLGGKAVAVRGSLHACGDLLFPQA